MGTSVDIRIVDAASSQRGVLENLMQLYAYDFSEILGLAIDDDGRFATPSLDAYWEDERCHPFLIRVDGRIAGFALVQQKSRLSDADDVWDMAELFVLRRCRRGGVGREAAHQLFTRFRGKWEVRQRLENVDATAFWRATISAFSHGQLIETLVDDARWRGPVQRFTSA